MGVNPVPAVSETDIARRVRLLSSQRWRDESATVSLIGCHPEMLRAQEQLARFAGIDAPVLITGETGTGKELFARGLYLLSIRESQPFLRVNCAQYNDSSLLASELFGHKRGSFTGAVRDHRGLFEEADRGVVFLDEIGELSLGSQALLLRAIGEGEVVSVGSTAPRRVNVRVMAATNRELVPLVEAGRFRADLYYRLAYLQLKIAPLRERGPDWKRLLDHYLEVVNQRAGSEKKFSPEALGTLAGYHWPGNVRELRGLVEMSHCLAGASDLIELDVFRDRLQPPAREEPWPGDTLRSAAGAVSVATLAAPDGASYLVRIAAGEGSFWSLVYEPFMDRELNRVQVRAIISEGLQRSNWSYTRALELFGIGPDQYLKFMDFLRHHRLKPER